MAWENVIIGYRVIEFELSDIIPLDARFLYQRQEFVRMYGFVSNPKPLYKTILFYEVPVYKKKNVKRK